MPYIEQNRRDEVFGLGPDTAGELNYMITTLCLEYLKASNKKYSDYNEVVGVLECAKLEFYRRAVSVYEDERKDINGDVYST